MRYGILIIDFRYICVVEDNLFLPNINVWENHDFENPIWICNPFEILKDYCRLPYPIDAMMLRLLGTNIVYGETITIMNMFHWVPVGLLIFY